jgi:hypothetical protein
MPSCCDQPGNSCYRPPAPPGPTLSEVTDWWHNATYLERKAFIEDIGGSVKTTHYGIDKYEVGRVNL